MIVICDTSPICYLILIEQIDILPTLFGQVIIPAAVRTELSHDDADTALQNWIAHPPSWLITQTVQQSIATLPSNLGIGEREAISLAVELGADLLIVDDWAARESAITHGCTITGLLGVLYRAGIAGQLDFPSAIACLQSQTTFRASAQLIDGLLSRYKNDSF